MRSSIQAAPRAALLGLVSAVLLILGTAAPAAAGSSYWWNGNRVEESWFSTHPTSYFYTYLSVDTGCGTPCIKYLSSSSSGSISSSGKINHWPSGGSASSALSCKWDTVGSGSVTDLECYRSY